MNHPEIEFAPSWTKVRLGNGPENVILLPPMQPTPKASINIVTTLTDKELANVVRHEYKDQRLTPAMAELLKRNGV